MELVGGARPRIVVVGEGMVERARDGGGWRIDTAGDTLNIAVHLARFGHDVAFATALGVDEGSDLVRGRLAAEGIDASLVVTDPDRAVGSYDVATDSGGERSFVYRRSDSAARQMFALAGSARLLEGVAAADIVVHSLITLAVVPPAGRAALLDAARTVRRRGGRVVFDGNYRPALWCDPAAARVARDAALAACDIGLPTLADETLLGVDDAAAVAAHWTAAGVGEVVVKLGADGARLPDGAVLTPPAVLRPVDTSGAGDAFDAAYLAVRLAGGTPAAAAIAGHRLAGHVVMQPGAIPPLPAKSPYENVLSNLA